MKLKLNVKELLAFRSKSSFIRNNNILPIYNYLKFDNGFITKANLGYFVIQEADFKGQVLLDENTLYSFISKTSDKEITVDVSEKKIRLSDSRGGVNCSVEPFDVFPRTQESEGEKFDLSNEVFCAINNASNFAEQMGSIADQRSCVYVGEKMVAASNAIIGYIETFIEKLPQIILPKEIANVVGRFNEALFSENERFMFFEVDKTKYGFIKAYNPFFNFTSIIGINKGDNTFTLNKKEFISFVDTCTSLIKEDGILATMDLKDNNLLLTMGDSKLHLDIDRSIIANGSIKEPFNFNPSYMGILLKNIPDEDLTFFITEKNYCYITGESGVLSVILPMWKAAEVLPLNKK